MTAGILRGIEDGWFTAEIAEAAFAYQTELEKGDKKIVGVNCHTATVTDDLEILRVSHEVELEQVPAARARAGRAATRPRSTRALAGLVEVARTDGEHDRRRCWTPSRAEATLGEICDALRAEWGEYTEPARF